MAHTRIRTFNTKDTYPEQKLDNDLCQAVVTRGGRTVYLRGQCPQDSGEANRVRATGHGHPDQVAVPQHLILFDGSRDTLQQHRASIVEGHPAPLSCAS